MILEHVQYAYNNAFRFPVRFFTMVLGIACATFCVLTLWSVVTVLRMNNEHAIQGLANGNVNYKQFDVTAKTMDQPVTRETLADIQALDGVEKGYYYEDLLYNMRQFEYLAPWIEWDNKLIIETHPILLDVPAAQAYGLDQKIIFGRYFSGDPNEIIISLDLFNRFVDKNSVIQNNASIIKDEQRNSLRRGNGIAVTPGSIIGQTVPFMYSIDFGKKFPQIDSLHSVPLKVVGVYDPKSGHATQGDVWLPLTLKGALTKLDFSTRTSALSGKLAVRIQDDSYASYLTNKVEDAGFLIGRTHKLEPMNNRTFGRLKVEQTFFSLALITAVIISLVSFIVISFLVISGRSYEFILQRALGLSKRKMVALFALEMCVISLIGSLLGLLLTLVLLNYGFKFWFDNDFYLPGNVTIAVIAGIPIIVSLISYTLIALASRVHISVGLAKGD